jgi:hypothetical protein
VTTAAQLLAPDTAAGSHQPTRAPSALPWWHGWLPVTILPCVIAWAMPATWPRWALMWALAFAIYFGCKWLTWRRTASARAPLWRHVGYLLAWPGMDAVAFFDERRSVPLPTLGEWSFAACKFVVGTTLLAFAATRAPAENAYWFGWLGMIGLVLMLHFGVFHLLSCTWRAIGVDAPPLMNSPAASASLNEFWGRRWNMAFRDLTYRFLFRPLSPRLGPRPALLIGFLVSGLVHDAVISFPAQGGYGGPTLYFLVQALGAILERSRLGKRCRLGAGWQGWLFTMAVLVAPAPLLFHPPFVGRVMIPFLHACGAL